MKPSNDEDFYSLIFAELKILGVKIPKAKKIKNCSQKSNPTLNSKGKIFGVVLSEQEWITENGITLPKFLFLSINYLSQFIQDEIGLFRKVGSIARQRILRTKLENGGSFDGSEPNDVASLLKQWLRELPEPLIPCHLQDLFLKCQLLDSKDTCLSAVLLSCLLLPCEHLYTIKRFLLFLSEIAANSTKNKMGSYNLAVIMAPNLFPTNCDRPESKTGNSSIKEQTFLVELLIDNAEKIGQIPPGVSTKLSLKLSEFEAAAEALNNSPSKLKKKRKNTGVIDIMCGIRKLVGNNSTLCDANNLEMMELHPSENVNLGNESKQASKRKADIDNNRSTDMIKRKPDYSLSSEMSETPLFTPLGKRISHTPGTRNRRKSFGLLKRKHKKGSSSLKAFGGLNCNKPLASVFCNNLNDENEKESGLKVENKSSPLDTLSIPKLVAISPIISYTSSPFLRIDNLPFKRTFSDCSINAFNKIITPSRKFNSMSHADLSSKKISPRLRRNICLKHRSSWKYNHSKSHNLHFQKQSEEKFITNNSPVLLKGDIVEDNLKSSNLVVSTSQDNLLDSSIFDHVKITVTTPIDKIHTVSPDSDCTSKTEKILSIKPKKSSFDLNENEVFPSLRKLNNENVSTEVLVKKEKYSKFNQVFKNDDSVQKGSNKHSIRRGRPNTIKTGLPSELCPKYTLDSSSLKTKNQKIKSQSISSLNLKNSFVSKMNDSSLISDDNVFREINIKKSLNMDIEDDYLKAVDDVSFNTWLDLAPNEFKSTESIFLPSESLLISEGNNTSSNWSIKHDESFDLGESSDKHSLLSDSCEQKSHSESFSFQNLFQENVLTRQNQSASKNILPNLSPEHGDSYKSFIEPSKNHKDESTKENNEVWISATTFRKIYLKPPPENTACKRESIIQIMKNNAGKVQQIVQQHNYKADKSTPNSKDFYDFRTPNVRNNRRKLLNENYDENLTKSESKLSRKRPLSLKACDSSFELKSNLVTSGQKKSYTFRSPKISNNHSPNVASPLKEVTNLAISRKDLIKRNSSPICH